MKLKAILVLAIALAGCTPAARPVTLMLDWVPNTNHTGLSVIGTPPAFSKSPISNRESRLGIRD